MDRFKLEDAIMAAEQVQQDLALLHEAIVDWRQPLSEDELCNYIMGIEYVAKLRQAKLWDVFTREFELDDYRPEAQQSWTEELFEDNELDVERELSGCDSGLNQVDELHIPECIRKEA
jgi:hypothetical protein